MNHNSSRNFRRSRSVRSPFSRVTVLQPRRSLLPDISSTATLALPIAQLHQFRRIPQPQLPCFHPPQHFRPPQLLLRSSMSFPSAYLLRRLTFLGDIFIEISKGDIIIELQIPGFAHPGLCAQMYELRVPKRSLQARTKNSGTLRNRAENHGLVPRSLRGNTLQGSTPGNPGRSAARKALGSSHRPAIRTATPGVTAAGCRAA